MRILIEESNVKFIKNIIDPKKIKFMQSSIKKSNWRIYCFRK